MDARAHSRRGVSGVVCECVLLNAFSDSCDEDVCGMQWLWSLGDVAC